MNANKIFRASLLASGALSITSCAAKQQQPNVILIVVDDMGYSDFGCFGDTRHNTPNIDRLAAEGIMMTDFHTNGPNSSPTRAALMTGQYQQRYDIEDVISASEDRDHGLDLSAPTIARTFKGAGYQTAIFGKWHLGYDKMYNPINFGFDTFTGYISGNVDYFSHIDQSGVYDWWKQDELSHDEGYTTDIIADYSAKFIAAKHKDPFFLYVPFEACHAPSQGPEDEPQRFIIDGKYVNKKTKSKSKNVYKDMVESLDMNMGKIMASIEAAGIADNTIVLFFSDNGCPKEESNRPFSGRKGMLLEGGHRVSGIAWAPGRIKAGSTTDETIITMDMHSTLCEATGIKLKDMTDGVSCWQTLTKGKPLAERTLFWRSAQNIAARKGPWKLYLDRKSYSGQLFNLDSDKGEKIDLSDQNPEIKAKLIAEVKAWEKTLPETKR